MKTQLIVLFVLLFLAVGSIIVYQINKKQDNSFQEIKYQGPVPQGYDENYFRKTGITKPLEN